MVPECRGMNDHHRERGRRYRVWLVAYRHWQPRNCSDAPPNAVALEPAEDGTMSARRAARYVAAFNRAALGGRRRVWAVAIPVVLRYEGDPRPGQNLPIARGGLAVGESARSSGSGQASAGGPTPKL